MRLAAISDIHSNAVAFQAVIDDLRRQSPDMVLCLGDIVMRGPQPALAVDMLRSLRPLATVRGNFDHRFTRWPTPDWTPTTYKDELLLRDFEFTCAALPEADQAWLANLPVDFSMSADGLNVELYHAGPSSLGQYTWPWASNEEMIKMRLSDSTNLVLFGHMHHPFVRSAQGFTIVNAGSVGLSFDGDNRASYVIIDVTKTDLAIQVRRVSYDLEAAIQVARSRCMP
ncbi:MAG TPA: metallophosphoesterase family protein [Symbiobacteriaceae bacterium]|nr:metallophosphoesterase family protein [Symbiobacteriaceae bacterium]